MSRENQMIGRRGEKQFSLLCSNASVTCNSSSEDDYGWDMHIEFPPRPRPMIALDMQPGQASALVQVKATTGTARRVTVSLENALRYARSPLPTFLLLVAFEDEKPRYFVRHVWLELIAAFLMAGRVADAEGRSDTNHIDIPITFSPEDEHSDDLLSWIEAQIVSVQSPYAASKANIVNTVGFGPTYGIAQATVHLQDADHFFDLQLGLRSEVSASCFTFRSERFGILAAKPEFDASDVKLTMTPEGKSALIRLEFPDDGVSSVQGKLYHAEHDEEHAFRVATRSLDLVFGPKNRVRLNARLSSEERVPLEDLDLFIRLQAVERGVPIPLLIDTGEMCLPIGSIKMNAEQDRPNWSWLVLALEALRDVAASASRSIPDMSMDDLDASAGALEIFGAFASNRLLRLDFTPEPDIPVTFDAFLSYGFVIVGGAAFAAVVRRDIIDDRYQGQRRQIGLGPAKLLIGLTVEAARWSPELITSHYERQLERLSEKGQVLAIGDISKVVGGGSGDKYLKADLPKGRSAPTRRRRRKTSGS